MRTISQLLLLLFLATAAWSQSATGSIGGTVTDPKGDAIPHAQVTIRNLDSTATRDVITDDAGAFAATTLPPANYNVTVKAAGFELRKPLRVTLSAGSSVRVRLQLAVAAVSEQVTVTGEGATVEGNTLPPTVNKQEPIVANSIAGLTVTYLPNRNRDFGQFGALAAGVAPDADESGLVVAGQRPESSETAVDGVDFNDPLHGGRRGAQDGALFFPQTVVREFQIVHAGATAEVGGTNAGFVNVATKSGSNKLHGEAFYLGRPSALTSRDTFGHELDNVQNEFGGSLGGPIKRDRAFYYVGAEQDWLRVPYWTEFATQAPGVAIPAQLAAEQRQIVSHNNPTALFARTDFNLSQASTLNLQLNWNRVSATDLNDGSTRTLAAESAQRSLRGHSVWLRGNMTTLFSPQLVNQLLAQWAVDRRDLNPNSSAAAIDITGFGVLGGSPLGREFYIARRVQFSDDLALTHHGDAVLQVGFFFADEPSRAMQEPCLNGCYSYNSLADYLAGALRRFYQSSVAGDPFYDETVRRAGFYVDEKLPLSPKVTITAGLRWDGQWNPGPVANDLNQWQPRLGLAWNPHSSTVVRLSGGWYDAATPADWFQRAFTEMPSRVFVQDSYFNPCLAFFCTVPGTPVDGVVSSVSPRFRNPRSFQASAAVEQQLSPKVTLSAGYLRNSTSALPRQLNRNLFPPTIAADGLPIFPTTRPDPTIGRELVTESNAHSTYDGLLLTASFQLPRRSQLTANYTLSRTRDDDTTLDPFSRQAALDPFSLPLERAYSNFDQRHNFNLSAVVNLPLGLKANPVLIARSGLPYTPLIGYDLQHDANDLNDRALLNGVVAGRNSLRQPGFFSLDLRFVKDITLRGEGHHLDLFMDIFNLTAAANRNFGAEAISVFGTPASPVFSAGQPLFAPATTRFGGPRQVQFTARLVAF